MKTEPPPPSSESNSALPPVPDLPDVLTKDYEQSRPSTDAVSAEAAKRSQPVTEERSNKRWTTQLYGAVREKGCIGNAVGGLLIVILLIAAIFYALDGEPLFPITGASRSSKQQPSDSEPQTTVVATPTFIILGQHAEEIFTYNSGVGKIFAYGFQANNRQEREVTKVPEIDKFLWHATGRLLLVSTAENALGNIYLYDLTQSDPEPKLPTHREDAPNFPPNLRVDGNSELAWSQGGNLIAFTARDIESDKESLFMYQVEHSQLIYTPARDMDSISSLLWVTSTLTTTTETLSFVAISNGQEGRYFVDRSGGGFTKWVIK